MGTRRDFLRQGSLWLAAGLITPAALDRLDWARHRVFALGSSLNHARVTLFAPNGVVLRRLAVPFTYAKADGGLRAAELESLRFDFDRTVTLGEIQTEIPLPFGPEHMAVNRMPFRRIVRARDTLTIQYPSPLLTLVD